MKEFVRDKENQSHYISIYYYAILCNDSIINYR